MLLDKQRIGLDLEQHSEVFYHFWNYCDVEETKAIPTAAVSFDKSGKCFRLSINPDFWAAQSYTQQLFILCHEFLHIYYKHGAKAKSLIKERRMSEMKIANVAMDLCVNRTLTTSFGFKRSDIDPESNYCWVDTVFKDRIEDPDRYFEYYFNLIKDNATVINVGIGKGNGKGGNLVDSHEGLSSLDDNEIEEILGEIADKTHSENAHDFIKKADKGKDGDNERKNKQAGSSAGNSFLKVKAEYRPKARWEQLVRQWCKYAISSGDSDNWVRPNRRMACLDSGELFLPSNSEYSGNEKEKVSISLFMDVSGSTFHLADRFFKCCSTIPLNKFDVNTYQFDTKVRELKNGEITGGGGTSYRVIEDWLIREETKGKPYPSSVWILTDSWGDVVTPKYPDRWVWLLTSDARKENLPKNCNYYDLSEFE